MNDVKKLNIQNAKGWLAGDVEIRLPKTWLAIGAVAFAVLLILAID